MSSKAEKLFALARDFTSHAGAMRRPVFCVVVCIAFSSFHVGDAAESSCQTLVFSGLSTSCNLNGGQSSSEDACCRALDKANAKRCFCDNQLMTTIQLVIGENGIQFFRDFAIGSCSGELTEGEACDDVAGDDGSEWDGVIAPPPPMDHTHTHRDLELSEIEYYTQDVRGSPPPDRRPTPLFPTRAPPERETIANFILDPRRDAEIGFTADALTLTGVRNDLDSNQTSTVFVPTNEAWYALLFRLGVTKEELFADTIWLADALRYHIVRDIAHTSNMGFGTSLMTDLDDEELHVEKYTDSRRSNVPVRVNGCFVHPAANRRDVRVGDHGVVHYIDCVLLPPRHPLPTSRTLAQYISSEPSVSMFANALAGATLMSELWNESRRFTVFAPTNDAFVRFLGDPRVGATFYDDGVFRDMLSRHVALGFHEISELATGRALKSLTTVAGDDDQSRVYVETRRRGEVFVNGCAVIGEQIFARDGAVHFIDCVLTD